MNEEERIKFKDHFETIKANIAEIIENQHDPLLRKKELKYVIDGYVDYLKRNGFGEIEIDLIIDLFEIDEFI